MSAAALRSSASGRHEQPARRTCGLPCCSAPGFGLELAQWLEGEEGTWALPPAVSEHAQPSMQQQQQVQPDKGQETVGPLYTLPVWAPGSSMTGDTVELATRHIIEARKLVAGQRRIARDLEATGLDAHAARTALDVFEDTLAVFEEHLQQQRELRRR